MGQEDVDGCLLQFLEVVSGDATVDWSEELWGASRPEALVEPSTVTSCMHDEHEKGRCVGLGYGGSCVCGGADAGCGCAHEAPCVIGLN